MDYILSHNWLLLLAIAYTSLVILKWLYVVRKFPYLIRCMREMKPNWNPILFHFMHVWLPISVLFGAFFVVPFALWTERRRFFESYPDSEMYEIAQSITEKGDAL